MISVLVAMEFGPVDVGTGAGKSDRDKLDPIVEDDGRTRTAAAYVETINEMCADKLDNLTLRVTQMNEAAPSRTSRQWE